MTKMKKMTINPNELSRHISDPMHVSNFLQGRKVVKNKKKYTRKEKHPIRYYQQVDAI